jgi:hypothetical protein
MAELSSVGGAEFLAAVGTIDKDALGFFVGFVVGEDEGYVEGESTEDALGDDPQPVVELCKNAEAMIFHFTDTLLQMHHQIND